MSGVNATNSAFALAVVGPQTLSDGSNGGLRSGRDGSLVISQAHGRLTEAVMRGTVFSIGCATTALSATTITLSATATPILAVWNPAASPVNLVMLQAGLQAFANTLTTPVGPGAFVWAGSVGNAALTLGSAPFNRKTMTAAGSQARGFPGGVALTGLTNNIVIFEGADFSTQGPLTYSTTTAMQVGAGGVQYFDGSLIVPPGGILALLNTTSTTTVSVAGRLVWEEVPV